MQICYELFIIGTSTISSVVYNVCHAVDIGLHHKVNWLTSTRILWLQDDFKLSCGLPAIVGAIDGTQISTFKPKKDSKYYFLIKI